MCSKQLFPKEYHNDTYTSLCPGLEVYLKEEASWLVLPTTEYFLYVWIQVSHVSYFTG